MFVFQKRNIVFNLNNLPEKIEERHILDVVKILGLPECCSVTFLPEEIKINIKRYENKYGHEAAKASILLSTEGFSEEGGKPGETRQLTLVEIREVEAAWMRRLECGLYLHVSPRGCLGAAKKAEDTPFITGDGPVYFNEFKRGEHMTRIPYLRMYASLPVLTFATKEQGSGIEFESDHKTPDLAMTTIERNDGQKPKQCAKVSNVETVSSEIYRGSEKPECLSEENQHASAMALAIKNGESTFVGKNGQVFKVIG